MLTSHCKKLALAISLASTATFMTLASGFAAASAPMVKTPAPGYFRMMLGAYEVTVLNDGTINLPVDKLLVEPEEKTTQALSHVFLKAPLETSVNAYLINTGNKLVLIDTGAGSLFGPTLGKLIANLKASGYDAAQIDDIYLTHMHGDHLGGLVNNNALAFPNAVVHADKHDADFWLSNANMAKAADDKKAMYVGAISSINPYIAAKKFVSFNGDSQLAPGITSHAAYGHTVGHTVYEIESEGQKLLLIGDLIHVAAVQFDHPEVTVAFDTDQKEAANARNKVFTDAAKQGTLVGAAHLQFPGLGHLRKDGKGYDWIPANFTQLN